MRTGRTQMTRTTTSNWLLPAVSFAFSIEFRVLLFNSGAQATPPPPPLDRLLAGFFDRVVKALDVRNAVRDGVDQIRE
ncbi:hypothetical protein ACMD2_27250 [Ananas comosus]|uniref:Uncharacterized protein n=1 Tax=Ananas comosus TaxID=4615 RepID=A0A199VJA1_ANACO|nr:hypothetical protein ACMD2_27250 [Ananas comosus]